MDDLWILLLLHVVGLGGAVLFRRLRIPAGGMIGALAASATVSILCSFHVVPSMVRPWAQLISGAVIGCRIRKENLKDLRRLGKPVLLMIPLFFAVSLGFGFLMGAVSRVDLVTALFGTAPGGMSDMALMADELGAESGHVVILQFSRLLGILLCFPPLFKYLFGREAAADADRTQARYGRPADPPKKTKAVRFLATAAVALVGGLTLRAVGFPAGMMVGAVFAVTVYQLCGLKTFMPRKGQLVVQVCSGVYLGSQFSMDTLYTMKELWLPVLLIWLQVGVMAFGVGYLVHRVTGLKLSTALMACSPGGLSEMAILSEELGVDAAAVTVLQTCRLLSVIACYPLLLTWVLTV